MTTENFIFPRGFVWGASTAAYQVEGGWNAEGKGLSIWDKFTHTNGRVKNGDTGDVACDHYHRYIEDFGLMKQLGIKAYRFSLSWPRIFPKGKGEINRRGLDYYDRLIDSLLALDIEPYITLYHWDLPQALQENGGWANRDTAGYFADYAAVAAHKFGDRVKNWVTVNEPWVIAVYGHVTGVHAPGVRDRRVAYQVGHNLLLAHGLATQAIRAATSDSRVGLTLLLGMADPETDDPQSRAKADELWQRDCAWFLDPLFNGYYPPEQLHNAGNEGPQIKPNDFATISQQLDFLGVNYYTRFVVNAKGQVVKVPGAEYTDMDWEVHPTSLGRMLLKLNQEYKLPPIFITENGAAVPDVLTPEGHVHDTRRIKYLHDHLVELRKAMKLGVNVRGYFLWSLMDNFEWAHGYSARFGLIYVDFKSQQRFLKDSAHWYERVIRRNEVHR
jgi:beta-glucosidase